MHFCKSKRGDWCPCTGTVGRTPECWEPQEPSHLGGSGTLPACQDTHGHFDFLCGHRSAWPVRRKSSETPLSPLGGMRREASTFLERRSAKGLCSSLLLGRVRVCCLQLRNSVYASALVPSDRPPASSWQGGHEEQSFSADRGEVTCLLLPLQPLTRSEGRTGWPWFPVCCAHTVCD